MSVEQRIEARQGLPSLILCMLGLGISLYLSYIYLSGSRLLCEGLGGCDIVAASTFAHVAGVPVPLLGVLGYGSITSLTLARWGYPRYDSALALTVFGLALVGILYSAFLTYVEFFVLYAVCPWCIASALTMTAVFVVATRDVLAL
ncbi:MAG: vitamin K epoxide reductase family protein [Bacteroidetes bacterium]|nr:vitamin K epoxide reductase family protein [Bacteroidota bacterium]MCL5026089.1 vitamin K epoxide reductase family protein [Chloroflexota bacterium]